MKYWTISIFLCTSTLLISQISIHNDEFNDPLTINNWKDINVEEAWGINQLEWISIDDSLSGHMQLAPITSSWYNEYRGAYMYKQIEGDFVLTIKMNSSARDGVSVPSSAYSLAGIFARIPQDYPNGALGEGGWENNQQNYIFLSSGRANNQTTQLEVKSTVNSSSTLSITDIDTAAVQLRLARSGPILLLLYRLEGADQDWIVHQRYLRNDFPELIQLGIVSYTDWDKVSSYTAMFHNEHELTEALDPDPSNDPDLEFNPDLIANIDFYRLDSLVIPAELENVDLYNEATDEELLGFLGYDSDVFCPDSLVVYEDVVDVYQLNLQADNMVVQSVFSNEMNAHLKADQITLDQGFELELGSSLNISIENCQ